MATTPRRFRPSPVRVAHSSEATEEQQPHDQKRPRSVNEWALGMVLLVFGGIAWLAGAKYTLSGWVMGLNTALAWLGLPVAIPMPASWFVLLAIPLGVVYSRVETRIWHRRSASLIRTPLFWVGWLIIVLSDVGSTYLGVRNVGTDSWTITQQVAASIPAAAVWAALLTFTPEWMIIGALRFLRY